LKLKEKKEIVPSFDNLIEDDLVVTADELVVLTSNIRTEICGVLDSFLSFLKKCEEKKTYNMFSFMLNSKFKSLW
jgi:hypothetical protein